MESRYAATLAALGAVAVVFTAAAQETRGPEPGSTAGPASLPSGLPSGLPAGLPRGYLAPDQLPDSLALLPAPPAAGTAAFARDEEAAKAMARPPGSSRFALAASDADLKPGHALQTFACSAAVSPDPRRTPALYRLLGKAMIDIGLSTYKAKVHYQRVRPFVAHGNTTCFPADEAMLRKDGSYPSGHSALGWGWALILAELIPERADAIFQRGRDFGESRLVCNVHWASDVDAGKLMASATVARLHAEAAFRADLDLARAELADAARRVPPAAEACRIEGAAREGA